MNLPELTYDELKAINALPDDATKAAVLLLDSLYMNGDLSVDQHAGIARGFLSLRAQLAAAQQARAEAEKALEEITKLPVGACNGDGRRYVEPCDRCGEAHDIANAALAHAGRAGE